MSDFDEPQKNVNIKVEPNEWLEAQAYFRDNPDEVKFQKKFTEGGKEAGHSFVKIGNDIFALNNTSHMVHESDAGLGGFARAKRGVNKDGRRIVVKVEGKERREAVVKVEEAKVADQLMRDMGFMLGRVERQVKEGESGVVKAGSHYQAGTKVMTAYEDRGNRDLFDEMNNNFDAYAKPPKNLVYGLKAMMGIEALHRIGIIHKDIKLENFVVNGEGQSLTVMPIDFDLAQKLEPGKTHVINVNQDGSPRVMGTPDFIAPEIISAGKYSYATDVYATGVMLEMIQLPEDLCKKMMAAKEADRISLPAAMEAVVKELKKTEYAQNPEVQQLLKQYEQFNFRLAAALSSSITNPSKQMTSALAHANKLPKKELLEYTKNVMQAAVDIENEKKPPAVPNVPNLFRSSGSGNFYVAVSQLLLKKYGFPSSAFAQNVAIQLKEINKQYQKFKDSGEAMKQAKQKAEGQPFKDEDAKQSFIYNEERAILELKLHELSANMKADIVSEFQKKVGPILPVFDPIRGAVGSSEKEQQDYMVAVFAGFCTLPLGKNPDIIKNDKGKIFSQLFRVSEGKNAAAAENIKLLQPLKEIVNASEAQRAQIIAEQGQQPAQQKQSQRSVLSKIGSAVTAYFANDFSTKAATAAYEGKSYVKKPQAPRANFREVLKALNEQGEKLGLSKAEQKAWRNNVTGPVALLGSIDPKISPAELNQIIAKQLDKFVSKVTYDPESDLRRAKQGGLNVQVVSLSEQQKARNAEIKQSVEQFKAALLPVKPKAENVAESQVTKKLSGVLNSGATSVSANLADVGMNDGRPLPVSISVRNNSVRMAADTPEMILLELKSTLKAFKDQGLEGLGVRVRLGDKMESPQVAVQVVLESIEKVKREKPNVVEDNPSIGVLEKKLGDYKIRLDKLETPKAQTLKTDVENVDPLLKKEPANPVIGSARQRAKK